MDGMNNNEQTKKAKYFEMRLNGFTETLHRLHLLHERLKGLELSLTGTRVADNKGEVKADNEPQAKPSIMQELNEVNERLNKVINNMEDSLYHLEEVI